MVHAARADASSGRVERVYLGATQMHLTDTRAAAIARQGTSAIVASIVMLLAAASTAPAAAQSTSLVGTYDGGQMEIAASLELKADRHFHYALSYGALDEEAAGTWTVSGDQVLLTSDPVVAPRFVLVAHSRGTDAVLQVSLDVPSGVSRQYFDAVITSTNGETQRKQLGDDGLLSPFTSANLPTSVRMLLPVFSIIGEPVKLDPSSGYLVRFRFERNDLGKVAFQAAPLKIVNGELLLDRHGRTIKFKRSR
jgi:hypothetical protein